MGQRFGCSGSGIRVLSPLRSQTRKIVERHGIYIHWISGSLRTRPYDGKRFGILLNMVSCGKVYGQVRHALTLPESSAAAVTDPEPKLMPI